MRKIIKLLATVVVTAFFIWLILKNVSFEDLGEAFNKVNYFYIIFSVVIFFLGYSFRIERWRLMLIQESVGIRWYMCAGPLIASVAANNLLPFRIGDLLRAFGFNKDLGISASTSLTSLFIERILDLLMIVFFLGMALIFFGMESSKLIGVGGGTLIIGSAILLALLFLPRTFKPLAFWIEFQISKIHPQLGSAINNELVKIFTALEHISDVVIMSKLVLLSVMAWISEGLVFWFVALSMPGISNNLAAWVAFPVGTLSTVIPSTPGYVGTFDYFTAESMIAMQNSPSSSIAFAFMVHAVLWLPPTLVGGIYFLVNRLKQQKNESRYL